MVWSAGSQSRPQTIKPVAGAQGVPHAFAVVPRARPDTAALLESTAPNPTLSRNFISLRGLLDQVLQVQQGSVRANVDLCAARLVTPGVYDDLDVAVPADTHVESCVEVEHDAQGRRCLAGWVHFSQPLTVRNGVRAFTAPTGLWTLARPLANLVTGYAFSGITFGTGRPTLLQGQASLLGIHAGWIDRRLQHALAEGQALTPDSPSTQLALQAVGNVGQASAGAGTLSVQAVGNLPTDVSVGLSDQSFALIPGGPYWLRSSGSFDLRQPNAISLQLQPPDPQGTLHAAALGVGLDAQAALRLEDQGDGRVHMQGDGHLTLAVNRLALDVRENDAPDTGGIRIVGGELRSHHAATPALVAPIEFAFQRGQLNASGLLRVQAGATFVDPGAKPPPFEDDGEACDVKGTLDLSAIVPRFGQPPARIKGRVPPDYAIRGVISVRPPSSDPVYYRMDVTPKGPDFELQPDYVPPATHRGE